VPGVPPLPPAKLERCAGGAMGRRIPIGPGLTAGDFGPKAPGVAGLTAGEPEPKMPGVTGGLQMTRNNKRGLRKG
jgi:hypothetical protein